MASLYHCGSSSTVKAVVLCPTGTSGEVLEIGLAPQAAADAEDMGRRNLRVELDVMMGAGPDVARVAEQIVYLVRLLGVDTGGVGREEDPAPLDRMGIDVDDGQDDVVLRLGPLTVGQQLAVVQRVEAQTPVGLQGGVLAADAVDPGDQVAQAVRLLQVPGADLVFLGVQVLLTPGLERPALAELEGRTVDAVAGPQGCGQHQTGHE